MFRSDRRMPTLLTKHSRPRILAALTALSVSVTLVGASPALAKPIPVPLPVYQDVPGASAPPASDIETPASSLSVSPSSGAIPTGARFTVNLGGTTETAPDPNTSPKPESTPTPEPTSTAQPLTPEPEETAAPTPDPDEKDKAAPRSEEPIAPPNELSDATQWQELGDTGIQIGALASSEQRRAGEDLPATIAVTILSEKERRSLGLSGLAFTFERVDGGTDEVPIEVSVPAAMLDGLYGADYSSRIRWIEIAPSDTQAKRQSLANPDDGDEVPGHTESGAMVLTPLVGSRATTVAAMSSAVSAAGTGDFSASSLKPSSSWDVSAQTGAFSWTYPMPAPPAPAGPEPSVGLTYNSQTVDGETGSTNNQPSVVGDGWELTGTGFIERSYVSCSKDDGASGPVNSSGDLCWKSDNATISFGSHTGPIVRDAATGVWKLEQDDGSRIERLLGTAQGCSDNGTYNTECWRLTTTDGTQYYFGLGKLPGWTSGAAATNATWTVPVFGNDAGEPCHASTFAASSCTQAWRWNLDYIVDVHGNAQTLYYHAETNKYALNGSTTTTYVRGGSLDRIEYGLKATTVYSANAPTSKVQFAYDTYGRCADAVRANCTAQPLDGLATTPAAPAKYPDVPYDQSCTGSSCPTVTSPSFWTVAQLNTVTTSVLVSGSYATVDTWTLGHSYPDPGDGTSAALWLTGVKHTGYAGSTSLSEPEVVFSGTAMQNRVWSIDGLAPLDKYRISSVRLETGAVISVNYSAQDCTVAEVSSILADVQNNHRRCFPQWWTPDVIYPQPPQLDLFHKYLVTSTVANPVTGGAGAPPVETYYDYSVGTPAWRYNDSPFTPEDYRTWSGYAGYDRVDVRVGSPTSPTSQQVSQYWFYQGMNGDRAAPGGGTKSVTVTGTAVADSQWLGGRTYQVKELNGVGGEVLSTTVTTPWSSAVNASNGSQSSRMVREGTVEVTEPLSSGVSRTTSTVTSYDATYGLPLTVSENNEAGTTSTCTTNTYAPANTTAWIVGALQQSLKVGKKCADLGSASYPEDSISGSRYLHDGLSYGSTPTKADVTETRSISGFTGSTADWSTSATSQYDSMGRTVSMTDALGRTTATAYTPSASAPAGSGPLTSRTVTNPAPYLWTTTTLLEPTRGNIVSVTDPNGKVVTASYDPLGRTSKVWGTDRPAATFPTSPTVSFAYVLSTTTASSVATTSLTPAGEIVSYSLLDGLGRKVQSQSVAEGGGTVVADTEYDPAGRTVASNNPYWTASVSPSGTLFVPFAVGQIPSRLQTTFDGAGRPLVQALISVGVERSRTIYSYSGADSTTVTPPTGATPTTSVVNSLGQQTRLIQFLAATPDPLATQVTTRYSYDAQGHMSTMRDQAGNTWSWQYDVLGRLVASSDPDAGSSTFTYDLLGNLLTSTDARGQVLANKYDNLNRKVEVHKDSATGTLLASWVFDTLTKGQQTSSTSYADGLPYTSSVGSYDDAYRPLSTTTSIPAGADAFGGTTYTEDLSYYQDGSPSILKMPAAGGLPAESLRSTYGSTGRLGGLRSGTSVYLSGVAYSPTGQVAQYTRPGAASTTSSYGYDQATSALMTISETTLIGSTYTNTASRTYTRDLAGNVTSASTTASGVATNTQCFAYDSLQNLTSAWTPSSNSCAAAPTSTTIGGPAPYWTTYAVDSVTGNRTQAIANPTTAAGTATARTFSYPAAGTARPHAVSSVATQVGSAMPSSNNYGYDASGHTTGRLGQVLEYDAQGRLAKTTAGSTTQKNVYSADGSLLLRVDSAEGATLFLGATELRQAPGSTVASGVRTYSAHGTPIAERTTTAGVSGSVLQWLTTDIVGTSLMQVNASTGVVKRRYLDPFGNATVSSPAWSSNHAYLNAPASTTTALTHLGAREYDPLLGRFLSVDAVLAPGNPQQNNGYSYAANSPITHSDPSGNCYQTSSGNYTGQGCGSSKGKSTPKRGPSATPPAAGNDPTPTCGGCDQGRTLLQQVVHIALTNPAWLHAWQHPDKGQEGFFRDVLGFGRNADGTYTSTSNAPQLWAGYTEFYDVVFDLAIPMQREKFEFPYNGTNLVVWGWKADYGNLGAGGEMAMYEQWAPGLWSAKYDESDMPKITTSVTNANTGAQIAYAAPDETQPWVATMNPYVQGANPADLRVTSTLTFSNTDIYDAFQDTWDGHPDLDFNTDDHVVTVRF